MAFGDQQIEWLSEDDVKVIDHFSTIMSYSGTLTMNVRKKITSVVFWTALYIPMAIVLVTTAIHHVHNFDLLAYSLHHLILAIDAYIVVVVIVSKYSPQIFDLLDGTRKTYCYDSDVVDSYARKIISERLRTSRLVGKMISIGSIGIIVEVQLFFVLETFCFKTYETIFPVYIGLDLGDPLVFTLIVLWQELLVYYTTYLFLIVSSLMYIVWSHLDLEIKILKFAIENVKEIVEERKRNVLAKGDDGQEISKMYELYCYHFAKHHASIIRYFNTFSECVWWITPLIFTTGMALFVTVGLSLMSDNLGIKLKLFWFLVLQVVVIYSWCLISQYIGDKSEEILNVVGSAPWWLMPKSCRSTFLLMMVRCRKPLTLATVYGTVANMECFMDMLKSVYQVINVIYQMKHG